MSNGNLLDIPTLAYKGTQSIDCKNASSTPEMIFDTHVFGICQHQSIEIMCYTMRTEWERIESGEVFYIPAGIPFQLRHGTTTVCKVVFIHCFWFDESMKDQKHNIDNIPAISHIKFPLLNHWIAAFEEGAEVQVGPIYYQLQAYLYMIAAAFLRYFDSFSRDTKHLNDYIAEIKQQMLEHYDTTFDIVDLVNQSGVGERRFYQAFKEHTGLSPYRFVQTVRLRMALQLLASRQLSVAEVAYSVGYVDELYFSRLFKKYMGIAPSEYAARAQISIANLCEVFDGDFSVLGIIPKITLKRHWLNNWRASLEEIQLLQPDVIISGPVNKEIHDKLSATSALEIIDWKRCSWRERLLVIADLLELTTVAGKWLTEYDQKVANARAHVKNTFADEPIVIAGIRGGKFCVYGVHAIKLTDFFYDELGFMPPDTVKEFGKQAFADLKSIAELQSNHIVILIEDSMAPEEAEELHYLWNQLREGRSAGHCITIPLGVHFMYNAAMHECLLDQIVNRLQLLTR